MKFCSVLNSSLFAVKQFSRLVDRRHFRLQLSVIYQVHSSSARPIGDESVSIQLAQCRFPGLAISDAKYKYIFPKVYGSNFIKQHAETVMV